MGVEGLECPTRGFPSPCAPGKGFPGLEQDLLASEDGIPCPPVPSSLGPSGLRVQVMKAPPKSCSMLPSCLMLAISHVHRVSVGLLRLWVDTDLCHAMDIHPHTLGS